MPKKTIFGSCEFDKDQRSNLSMWKTFPMPKLYNCQIWLKPLIIREILRRDHNVAAAVARKLTQKQISALSGTLNYDNITLIK